jgi:transposase
MSSTRTPYPFDVSDEEWAVVALYLVLLAEDAPQRRHALREVFKGLRYIVRTGAQWRMMLHDLPPWPVVYQQTRRWVVERDFAWRARFRRRCAITSACRPCWLACASSSSPVSCLVSCFT